MEDLLSISFRDKDSFKKVGDKVVLSPGSVSDPITSITWKHGPDIAVEWYGGDIVPYRDFRGRCEVSTSTGTLTLSNVTVKDSGIYTAEINNRVMSPTKITVISAVPKPTVSKSCNPEMTICTLTCEASITDDTKPVTYSWMTGDKQTAQPSSNQLTLAKNDTGSVEKSISCQLENPVSSERSDNIIISFASGDSLYWIIPLVIVLLVLIAAVIVFFLCKIYRKREIKTQDEANRPEEMVQLVGIQSNGADLSVQGTSSSSVVPALNSPNNVVTAPQIHNENELMSADDENEAETSKTTSEVKDEPSQDQTPAASTDSSSKPETSKTTSEVKDEPSQDQTPAASTDSNSKPDMPALDSKSNETSDSEPKPETETSKTTSEVKDEPSQDQTPAASTDSSSKPDNVQEPQQGPERTT
uniref:Ig-like domain-containing protein n=1 Tax=Astatotilapia calliptera TaxID=8154 RepID=A0AAX7W089_ASTCA